MNKKKVPYTQGIRATAMELIKGFNKITPMEIDQAIYEQDHNYKLLKGISTLDEARLDIIISNNNITAEEGSYKNGIPLSTFMNKSQRPILVNIKKRIIYSTSTN